MAARKIQKWAKSREFKAAAIQRRWSTILEATSSPDLAIEGLLGDMQIRSTLLEQSKENAALVIQVLAISRKDCF